MLEKITYVLIGIFIITAICLIGGCIHERDKQTDKFMQSYEFQQALNENSRISKTIVN
jgi:preprotein translocase subunit SecG